MIGAILYSRITAVTGTGATKYSCHPISSGYISFIDAIVDNGSSPVCYSTTKV